MVIPVCIIWRKVTPNQHELAREFVLLDNFYVDGEVSADGHNWSMGGYATDYLGKNMANQLWGRGGKYDAEGIERLPIIKMDLSGIIAKGAGVSYRTYGEFADDYKPNIPVLKDHYCPYLYQLGSNGEGYYPIQPMEKRF